MSQGLTQARLLGVLADQLASLVDVRLFVNNITPDESTAFGAYVEPGFTGYAAQALAWGSPAWDGSTHKGTVAASAVTFGPETDHTSTQVYGFFVTDGAGTATGGVRFAGAPLTINDTLPALTLALSLSDMNV